ncbi:hotdog family protein [Chromobacterium subtsugae]|uniref:ApeP family dehydratase n=1 Tax=Chromobacterium subtsugae TaxID=251747 RepID=UPI0006418007|nr:hotdog family protein [Chromobacterium subtsugae]
MSDELYEIDSLVPHAGDMSLLDRVLSADADSVVAEVTPRLDQLFCRDGEIGSWVGIEYMAQTIGVWAGLRAKAQGRPPKVGFLLGTRRYTAEVSAFAPDVPLQVSVTQQFISDNGLCQFDCHIDSQGRRLATAQLKVFEPADIDHFIKESSQ